MTVAPETGDPCIHGPGVDHCGHPDCVGYRAYFREGWRPDHGLITSCDPSDPDALAAALARVEAAEEELGRYREKVAGLARYVRHLDNCEQLLWLRGVPALREKYPEPPGAPCSCGLRWTLNEGYARLAEREQAALALPSSEAAHLDKEDR